MPRHLRPQLLSVLIVIIAMTQGCDDRSVKSVAPPVQSRTGATSAPVFAAANVSSPGPATEPAPPPSPASPDLVRERTRHPTVLKRHGPAPQRYQAEQPPAGVQEVIYSSGKLMLKAWLAKPPGDGPHPAVVFCHGGFSFGADDWEQASPFLKAGFVLMMPMLRGENGNPGEFELWFGEIDDAIAAGRYVAAVPGVDTHRIFIAGHSSGATTAMLAAVQSSPFVAAAAYGPTTDCLWLIRMPQFNGLAPFDPTDTNETYLRSPKYFITGLNCPLYIYVGDSDQYAFDDTLHLDGQAADAGKKCIRTIVPGDHFSSVPLSIQQTIGTFLHLPHASTP
jgi:dienelactone hydrolase